MTIDSDPTDLIERPERDELDVLSNRWPLVSGQRRGADAITSWDGRGSTLDPIEAELAEQERSRHAPPRRRITADDLDKLLEGKTR